MLGKRIVTALVLLAVLLPAIFCFDPWVWGMVTLVFLVAAVGEWARLLDGARSAAIAMTALLALGIALLAWRETAGWPPAFVVFVCAAATIAWLVPGLLHLRRHDARGGGLVLAASWLLACWIALVALRSIGPLALLTAMAVVWVADIAAYGIGKAFGRHKLAPVISPGKSREGAIGGLLAVALLGLAVATVPAFHSTLPARLLDEYGVIGAGLVLVALAALSIVGDLHESLLKRQAGVKDSGTVLPGHGGVLDRIDALIPVMPAAMLLHRLLG